MHTRGAAAAIAVAATLAAAFLALRIVDSPSWAAPPPDVQAREVYERRPQGPTFDHSALDATLVAHVRRGGWVDYHALSENPSDLDTYLRSLASANLAALGRDEKLALLINAYNAFTLRLILDHWPVGSIKDIPAARRWKDRRWSIAGQALSLDDIEHQWIRRRFIEPRIHFALVCAAVGCPPLRREAYSGSRIDAQLADQARLLHSNPRWFRYDAGARVAYLTRLYDWYESDFVQVAGSVPAFVARYSDPLARTLAAGRSPKVRWLPYDWSLNDVSSGQSRVGAAGPCPTTHEGAVSRGPLAKPRAEG